MSNNRELSEFADYLTVDDTTKNVGIGTTLKISAGGIFVANTEVIRPDGTWGGPDTGLVGAQGAQGAQGFQGAVGAQGAQGAVGAQGAQGAQGYQGAAGSATITNNADDRVITGGSGSNLNGEANLTFNGSSLRVNTTTSDAKLEVNNSASKINIATLKTTGGAGSIAGLGFMVGQTSSGREKAALYFQETNGGAHYTGDLVFALNNDSGSANQVSTSDERMRITSSGKLGIGTDSPSSYYADQLVVDIGSSSQNGITIKSGPTAQGIICFADGTSGTERYSAYIDYHHNTNVLSFGTNSGNERFRLGPAGQFGIGGAFYGASGQVLTSQGSSAAPQWATPSSATWTSASVNAGPTGGVVAFTSIPSDIDFFIMSWNNVNSTNNNEYSVEMGHSGSYQTSGYNVNSGYMAQSSTIGVTRYTSSFYWRGSAGGGNNFGRIWFSRHNTGNVWHAFGNAHDDGSDIIYVMSGSCSLGGTLDRIRLILSSGGFDSQGSVTIQYLRT